jgi:hypothetical protein
MTLSAKVIVKIEVFPKMPCDGNEPRRLYRENRLVNNHIDKAAMQPVATLNTTPGAINGAKASTGYYCHNSAVN